MEVEDSIVLAFTESGRGVSGLLLLSTVEGNVVKTTSLIFSSGLTSDFSEVSAEIKLSVDCSAEDLEESTLFVVCFSSEATPRLEGNSDPSDISLLSSCSRLSANVLLLTGRLVSFFVGSCLFT